MVIDTGDRTLNSAAYRRRARRLRWLYADDPLRLHRSLRRLADSCDAGDSRGVPWPHPRGHAPTARGHAHSSAGMAPPHSRGAPATEARQQFADAVAAAVAGQGAVLRYSQRLALLHLAAGLGIGRFEANLVIAFVQHCHRGTGFQAMPDRSADQGHFHLDDHQHGHRHEDQHGLKARATSRPTLPRTLLLYGGIIAAVQGLVALGILRLIGV